MKQAFLWILIFFMPLFVSCTRTTDNTVPEQSPPAASPGTESQSPSPVITGGADNEPEYDYQEPSSKSEFHQAVIEGKIDMVKEMLKKDPKLANKPDENGFTPLFFGAIMGNLKMVTLLLDKGADVNGLNSDGKTPLHGNVMQKYRREEGQVPLAPGTDVLELLIKKGAKVNVADNNGMTPLHLLAQRGGDDHTKLLLDSGADFTLKDKFGHTALFYAKMTRLRYKEWEVEDHLRKRGAKE